MKKLMSVSLAAVLAVSAGSVAFAENVTLPAERNTINVVVNGKAVEADNYLIADRTYIPLRAVSECSEKMSYGKKAHPQLTSMTIFP